MSAGMGPLSVVPVSFLSEAQMSEAQPVVNQPEAVDASNATTPLGLTEQKSTEQKSVKPKSLNAIEGLKVTPSKSSDRKLHRIAEARQQQGLSLRTISRRTAIDIRTLRAQEQPQTDLTLSELGVWQVALEVPLIDLIEDDAQPLSRPVKERACMVRIMKTVVAIKELGGSPRLQRLVEMLEQQLCEIMPELSEIGGWPQHGSRRGQSTSRTMEQQIDTRTLDLE